MKDLGEAASEGAKHGLKNFLSEGGKSLGKVLGWIVLGVIALILLSTVADYIWSGFTSPFRGAWEWTSKAPGNAWDWATGWWPDKVEVPPAPAPTPVEVPPETEEPGFFCKGLLDWNPLCKD